MNVESILIITIGLGFGALCKGATGFGLPSIALPFLASSFGVPHAIAVLAVPIIVANGWQTWRYRGHSHMATFLPRLLASGTAGIAIGTILLKAVPSDLAVLTLGLVISGYILFKILRPSFKLTSSAGNRLAPLTGLAAGVLQGVSGICGPVLITFMHSLRLPREAFIFAISTTLLMLAVIQLPALAVSGLITWVAIAEGIFALLPLAIFMPLGARIARCLSPQAFELIIFSLLAVMALRLITQGLGLL